VGFFAVGFLWGWFVWFNAGLAVVVETYLAVFNCTAGCAGVVGREDEIGKAGQTGGWVLAG